jgi:Protein of unknown function (DUF3156)
MRWPAGYRPGALIAKVRQDLARLEYEALDETRARFRCPDLRLDFLAEERVHAQFLMHVVSTKFSHHLSCEGGSPAHIRLRHRGAWTRRGIECVITQGREDASTQETAHRLSTDAPLAAAMLALDFTDFELERQAIGWVANLAHYGASEVVYRFPATRQYVRLSPEQQHALLHTFARLSQLLGQGRDW